LKRSRAGGRGSLSGGPPRLPFDDLCAEHYGSIRTDLRRSGGAIGPNDLLIAATARAHDLTLVTHNTGEFSRVVGLRSEDWQGDEEHPPEGPPSS
jgi:tRNA(fMet)-specific endonuclease VapC